MKGGNMEIKVEGNKLTIVCTIGAGVLSSSGKTLVVCSTGGFVNIPNTDLKLSLNVTKSRK